MDNFNAENVRKISSNSTNFNGIKKLIQEEIIDRAENGYMSYPLDSKNIGVKTYDAFIYIRKWLSSLGFKISQYQCFYTLNAEKMKFTTMVEWE